MVFLICLVGSYIHIDWVLLFIADKHLAIHSNIYNILYNHRI